MRKKLVILILLLFAVGNASFARNNCFQKSRSIFFINKSNSSKNMHMQEEELKKWAKQMPEQTENYKVKRTFRFKQNN